ncbi:MAG: TadE/TadG family type IV pilus assembly protein [Bacilli bacterium]
MNRKGQALVEFVLILPVFILILFAIVDFGTILSKKNELENDSIDIVLLINNGANIDEIKNKYSDLDIELKDVDKYTEIKISKNINIITPGLNLILGNPYKVIVERVVPNDEA